MGLFKNWFSKFLLTLMLRIFLGIIIFKIWVTQNSRTLGVLQKYIDKKWICKKRAFEFFFFLKVHCARKFTELLSKSLKNSRTMLNLPRTLKKIEIFWKWGGSVNSAPHFENLIFEACKPRNYFQKLPGTLELSERSSEL